ncbi:hypothetical protein [Microbulbifer sp. TB1203]|nr:hypothetical protein [Microbulbifer sp. TB1203]
MDEHRYRLIDLSIKSFALMGAAIAFFSGIYQFQESNEKDYKLEFWNKQLEVCSKGSELSTKLAIDVEEKIKQDDIYALYQIIYGDARYFLTDKPRDDLMAVMQHGVNCSGERISEDECNHNYFNSVVLRFAQSCRDMLAKSWNMSLHTINDGRRWIYD